MTTTTAQSTTFTYTVTVMGVPVPQVLDGIAPEDLTGVLANLIDNAGGMQTFEITKVQSSTDAWGRRLLQPGDGHHAWSCNNYACTDHPESLYGR